MKNRVLPILLIPIIYLVLVGTIPNDTVNNAENNITFVVDTAQSILHWDCHHLGNLSFKEGQVILTKDNEPIAMNLTIDMTSIKNIDIDNELLQGTLENVLKSNEFFDVQNYPEAKFESHSITKISEGKYKFVGDFIIFGNGICHEFDGTIKVEGNSLYFNTNTFIIDRTDWGLFYVSANNPSPKKEETGFVVTDTILLHTHIVAYKKE